MGMREHVNRVSIATLIAVAAAVVGPVQAQPLTMGAPVASGPEYASQPGPRPADESSITATGGAAPEGIEPLPVDIYTTKDFYLDEQYWEDPRYYRCSSPNAIEALHGGYGPATISADTPVAEAPWGNCDRDYGVEEIQSPYPFTTAAEHWAALKAEVESRGGPTKHTFETMPDFSGQYRRQYFGNVRMDDRPGPGGGAPTNESPARYPYWMWGEITQASSFVQMLTPEYKKRMVQDLYHDAVSIAPQWPLSYCWPEGYLRWYTGTIDVISAVVRPEEVVFLGQGVGSSVRVIQDGREFQVPEVGAPYLTEQQPRWYGESISMWDGDRLIVWTSNVQPWTSHQLFDHSDLLQSIEIFTAKRDAEGKVVGLESEAIFYDENAFVKPLRQSMDWVRLQDLNVGSPYTFNECLQTIFPVNGRAAHVSPGETVEITVPDMFDRPWARIQEQYFEEGMSRPDDSLSFLD